MKMYEFDESDVNNLIYCMNDVKIVIRARDKVQHEVNILTVKRDDLLRFGRSEWFSLLKENNCGQILLY